MSNFFNDFFGSDDRRIELGNLLVKSLESRHGFHGARNVLKTGDASQMSADEQAWYAEWKPLDDKHNGVVAEVAQRQPVKDIRVNSEDEMEDQ